MSKAIRQCVMDALMLHRVDAVHSDGVVWCLCERNLINSQFFAMHQAEMVLLALADALPRVRVAGQIDLLGAAIEYWGGTSRGVSPRSHRVYSGAQIAGWCRQQRERLNRSNESIAAKPEG